MGRLPESNRNVSLRDRANSAVHRGGRPIVLRIAEAFLMVIVAIYFAKVVMLAVGMYEGVGMPRTSLFMFMVEIVMLYVTADSLIAVSSRHPRAWKKVTRASVLLIVFNLIYWFGASSSTVVSYIAFSPVLVTPAALFIMLVMYWEPIRRYYMPVMEDEKSVWEWFKYSWVWPLYTAEEYRVMYDDERR